MRALPTVVLAALLAIACEREAPVAPPQPDAASTAETADRESARLN